MSKRQEKQPWNPYPLAVLNIEGLSRGAKHILTVLAARSNYKGETCVGHRRLTKDCQSSKQYVTDGLKELYEKKLVSESPRNRQKRQADWKIISPVVLQARTMQNPTEQVNSKSYPVGHQNPTEQELNNPTQQGRTLQIKKNPNLTDGNLSDLKSVNESVSVAQGFEEEIETPSGFGSEEQTQTQNQDPDDGRPTKPDFGDGIESLWSEGRWDWVSSSDAHHEVRECFPALKVSGTKPTDAEMRLMQEIIVQCDSHQVLPRQAMGFARKHKQNTPALIPRSVQGLWDATCGLKVSTTNGLLAQTKEHDPKVCGICVKELQGMPCTRCKGTTFGKPTIEDGKPFCSDCMKLPRYRRHSGQRDILEAAV